MRSGLALRDGTFWITPESRQDSSLMTVLSAADCLLVRAPHAPAAPEGTPVAFIPLTGALG
jgi:molybdopterin molybdotransferase